AIGGQRLEENCCRGHLQVEEHDIAWDLRYRSQFRVTLSDKGWIGFSRTPHSDARFEGRIALDDKTWEASPIGFGLQGHNCGYRPRGFWTWTHAYFVGAGREATTLEALTYDMPFGLIFRRVVLWHAGSLSSLASCRKSVVTARGCAGSFAHACAQDGSSS